MMGAVNTNMRNLIVQLNESITVNFPNIDGSYSPVSLDSLNCVLYDDNINRIIKIIIKPAIIPVYLYSGDSYQNLTDLSDQILSSKIIDRLGDNIENKLNDLIRVHTGYRRV